MIWILPVKRHKIPGVLRQQDQSMLPSEEEVVFVVSAEQSGVRRRHHAVSFALEQALKFAAVGAVIEVQPEAQVVSPAIRGNGVLQPLPARSGRGDAHSRGLPPEPALLWAGRSLQMLRPFR